LRRVAALGLLLLLAGCASAVKTVAGFQNNYDFRIARYTEACVVPTPPATCAPQQAALKSYEKSLHEAAVALKWGGPMPLQLKALKAADKAAAK
jgi:hypothetical protein